MGEDTRMASVVMALMVQRPLLVILMNTDYNGCNYNGFNGYMIY